MNQISNDLYHLSRFGTPEERVARAIKAIQAGLGVVVADDEDRENEGDLIFAAQTITPAQVSQMIRDCSGIVCLVLTDAKCRALGLPMMVEKNSSQFGTPFTVSIEAKEGVTTGVSAADRATTILTASAAGAKPSDLVCPGHIFPLRAHPEGLAKRRGHTEATIELMRLAGVEPAGVLCEVTNPDGTMARLPQLADYAIVHKMPIVTIEDLVAYRQSSSAK